MEDWIKERINRVEDLKDRRALRDAVAGALVEMQEYNKDLYAILEQRLSDELTDFRLEFDVYTAVCARDDYDPINDFLYPMDPQDLEIPLLDVEEMQKNLGFGQEIPIARLFLACETEKVRSLLKRDDRYSGRIRTDGASYDVELALRPCTHYKDMLSNLYQSFLFNDIAWKTLHAPYLEKFVEVVLTTPLELTRNSVEIRSVEVNLRDYEPYKLADRIPLWNLDQMQAKCTHFPMPAYDSINYEHTLSLEELGRLDNYLVRYDNVGALYVKRNRNELVVVTSEDRVRDWDLIAIHTPREARMSWIYELIFDNSRTRSFLERYAATLSMNIRTKGEVERLLYSFIAFEGWSLKNIRLLPKKQALVWKESNDHNFFLQDHVRVTEEKPVLELSFTSNATKDYLLDDHLQFFVSEIQLVFPDYYCIGKIVE